MSSRILGGNLLASATITSSGADASYPAANMVDGRTNRQAGFLTGATRQVVFDLGIAQEVNALGIAKHNLGTMGATIDIETSDDNSTYYSLFSEEITSDDVQYFEAGTSHTRQYIRVSISGHGGTAYISDLTIAKYISTTTGQPVGFVDPVDAFNDQITSNVTRGNELAGISITARPKQFKINARNIPAAGFDAFAALVYSVVTAGPFYFKWAVMAEDGYDGRPAFCWLRDKMPDTKWDGAASKGMIIDVMGFT